MPNKKNKTKQTRGSSPIFSMYHQWKSDVKISEAICRQDFGSEKAWDFLPAVSQSSCEMLASSFNSCNAAKPQYAN